MNARTIRVSNSSPTAMVVAPDSHNPVTTELTARELDVLTLIGKSLSNSEIASQSSISGVTVKTHIGRIFGKLDLRDRAAAIVYAYDNGIVAPR